MKKSTTRLQKRYQVENGHSATAVTDAGLTWRNLAYWRNLFLYYWFFAFFGHLAEVIWRWLTRSDWFDPNNIPTITPLAAPYGFGAVAIILFVYPLCKRAKKPNFLVVFLLSAVVATAVELLCALVITAFLGHNPFWDYSREPFNIGGFICLRNAVLFGIASTIFLRTLFPKLEKHAKRVSENLLNDLFLLLFTTYILDVLLVGAMWLKSTLGW